MKYISIYDYDGVIYRCSCDTLCSVKYYHSIHFSVALSGLTNSVIKYYGLTGEFTDAE